MLLLEESLVWVRGQKENFKTTGWLETTATKPSGAPATPAPPATRMSTPRSRCLEQTGSPGTGSASGAQSWDAREYQIHTGYHSKYWQFFSML